MAQQFLLNVLIFNIYYNEVVLSVPLSIESPVVLEEGNNTYANNINNVTVDEVNNMRIKIPANIPRSRAKRQNSGAGRFAEASKMPQLKLLRLFLQMFKNFWDRAYVGGTHPLHPNVPRVIVELYKEKVVEFFIPDVGEEKAMQ